MTDAGDQTKTKGSHSLTGEVTSVGGRQTIHVTVHRLAKESRYGKYVRRRTRLAVHDPLNQAHPGDLVEVAPCRRLSKTKSWRLMRIVRSGNAVDVPGQKG
jgi:small subunit ribosomal protein S17